MTTKNRLGFRQGWAWMACLLGLALPGMGPSSARGEAMLQFFNASWNEIAEKVPELAEAGYTSIWLPPPAKANGGYSVGYDLFDPFDLGSTDLRGTWSTRYGTEAELHNLVDTLHRFGIRVYFDNIMNHRAYDIPGFNESTPVNVYPGMVAEDFHLRQTSDGFYRKWDNCRDWNDEWQVLHLGLSDLIDIAHETPNQNFGTSEGSWHDKPSVVRHPNNPEFYDRMPNFDNPDPSTWNMGDMTAGTTANTYVGFGPGNGITTEMIAQYPNFFKEDVGGYLCRAVRWMMDTTKADGFRLDAVKHVPDYFFGNKDGANKDSDSSGYLGHIQWQYNMTHGYSDWSNHRDTVFNTSAPRDDAMVFGEHLGSPPGLDGYIAAGMRLVDNPLRNTLVNAISSYTLNGYDAAGYGGLSAGTGVMHSQSHDNVPLSMDRRPLEQAFYMMREGLGLFYTDGNTHAATLSGSGGAFPRWAESCYLGQWGDTRMPNLCLLNGDLGRGSQKGIWSQGDFVAWERLDWRQHPEYADDAQHVTCLVLANANWTDGVALPAAANSSFPHTAGGAYGSDAYLYQYADVPYVDWNPHFYTYASDLSSHTVPANSYYIFGYKNPDASDLWAGDVIEVLEDGCLVDSLNVDRVDGPDGDPNYNPYGVADTNHTDYTYTMAVPRITKGTNVQFRVTVDGSAGNVLLRLDGGMDLNGETHSGGDLRDNPPALSDDVFLGYENIPFAQRIWAEQFAASNTVNCQEGSAGATSYQNVIGQSAVAHVESSLINDYGTAQGQVAWVYHEPSAQTDAIIPATGTGPTTTNITTNTYLDSAANNTGASTAAITGFGAWNVDAYSASGSSWSGWFVNNTDPANSGISGMGYAYGLFANPNATAGITMNRALSYDTSTEVLTNFSIQLGMHWDSNLAGSYKGFELYDDTGSAIFGVQMGNSATLTYYGAASETYSTDYGVNAFTVSVRKVSGGYSVSGTTRSGGTFSPITITTAKAPVGYKVYMNGADSDSRRQMYFTDARYQTVKTVISGGGSLSTLVSTNQYYLTTTSAVVWVKSAITNGASAALYYTTNGTAWPEGAGGLAANASTKVVNGTWMTNGTDGASDWWRFDIPRPVAGTTLRYKAGVFRRQSNDNGWETIWPGGAADITKKHLMMGQWNTIGQNLKTKSFHQHNDYNSWTTNGLVDGFHLLTARAFLNRTDGAAIYKTFRQTVYLDTETPRGELLYPESGTTSIGGSEYGFVLRTDPSVTAVYYHITDSNNDNDGTGNGTVSNAVVWGTATSASAWTQEMAKNETYPKLWRFTYSRIPASGSATIRIRLVECSSTATNQWSASSPTADNATTLHYTELTKTLNTRGEAEEFYFAWPGDDGTFVEEGWTLRLNYSSILANGLSDPLNNVKVYINSSENGTTNRGTLFTANELNLSHSWGDGENTISFDMPNVYNGMAGWLYGIRVEFTNGAYSKVATRLVTHEGARLPSVTITTPPEEDSDGAKYIITMADVPASVIATNTALRQTPIVVQTESVVTNVLISFVSPMGYVPTLTCSGVVTNNDLKTWNYVWTVTNAGTYRFLAAVWANTNGTTLSAASNSAMRNATIEFREIATMNDTNNLDWDDDGILNTNENTSVSLPVSAGEYWTQFEVFSYFASGKSAADSPDTDGDGLPDALELGYRAIQNTEATDATADTNGDGYPNFIADLDPPFYNTTDNYNKVPDAESSTGGSSRTKLCGGSTTDPTAADSDYDGLPDGIEDANRNGWADGDGESLPTTYDPWLARNWPDGLIGTSEAWEETSPCLSDSDGDGLSDGYGEDTNYNGRTDMAVQRSSGTAAVATNFSTGTSRAVNYASLFSTYPTNGSAVWPRLLIYETDPLQADTDGDALPDGWEKQYGFSPLDNGAYDFSTGGAGNVRNGAAGDPDDDGFTNLQEYQNGTNPTINDTLENPGGEGAINIGQGSAIGSINGVTNYNEFLDWSLDDLIALDNYDQGGNSSDIYRSFGDDYNTSRDLIAFYFHDGGSSSAGGDDKLYFRVDLLDLQAFAEESGLNVYVAIKFGNYGNGGEYKLPDEVNAGSAMHWNACVGVYDSANGVLYVDQNSAVNTTALGDDLTAAGVVSIQSGFHGAYFNSELDAVAWSIDRTALTAAGWTGDPDLLTFQVYTTKDFTGDDGGSGDKGGLNDFTDCIGDDWLCSDYYNDYDYVAANGVYTYCVGRSSGGYVFNHCGKSARLALLAHGNQAVENSTTIQNYVNNGAGCGYHRPVKIHNIYTNCPLNLHITPTLAMAMEWAEVGTTNQAWRSGPGLNDEIAAGVVAGNFRLLGSTYSDHILDYFTTSFNAANVALASDTLNRIYGGSTNAHVVSTNILWSAERVSGLKTMQAIHDLGFRATVIDQTPHLLAWFGREDALGDNGYKLNRFWLENTGTWDSLDAFVISSSAADYRYLNNDNGLPIELRQLFNRRARSGGDAISTLFYNWEDFATSANAKAYDASLRWVANHPWIQVVAMDEVLDVLTDVASHDLTASTPMSMQDWVNHACNTNYNNWFFGSSRHEGLAPKRFEIRAGATNATPLAYGSMTNGILSNVWKTVSGLTNASVKRLALQTLGASVFETAFHNESNTDLSRWSFGDYMYPSTETGMGLQGFAWRAQSQTRRAAVYSAVDAWANRNTGRQAITNLDLDCDGETECILRNNAVMAIFERQGGWMIGAWCKQVGTNGVTNVVQMIGNFVSIPYSGCEDEGVENATALRTSALKDWWNGSTNGINSIYTVTTNASSLIFTNSTLKIGKTISLASVSTNAFSVTYKMNGTLYVRNGFSPDLDTLLTLGQSALSESNATASKLEFSTTTGNRTAGLVLNVTTGAINTAATDQDDADAPTVAMRNQAQTRQVDIVGTNTLGFQILLAATHVVLSGDSDGDGLPDDWELQYFGSTTGADANADSDNDHFSNYSEWIAGTSPIDASAYIGWESKVVTGPTSVELTFLCVSGRTYYVELSDAENLRAPSVWTQTGSSFVATNTHHSWTDSTTNFTARFYRLRVPRSE